MDSENIMEKPSGIQAGTLILENIYTRFERTYDVYKNVLEKEQSLMEYKEPIFLCLLDYLTFKECFDIFVGEEEFEEYETNLFKKVISELKSIFFNTDITYTIKKEKDLNVIELSINLIGEEYPILYINPYFRDITLIDNEEAFALNNKIEDLNKKIEELLEEQKKLEIILEKPIFGSTSPMDMIKTTVRKKKKIEETKFKLAEIDSLLIDYNLKIREAKSAIEEIDIKRHSIEKEKAIIYKKLVNSYAYYISNPKADEFID